MVRKTAFVDRAIDSGRVAVDLLPAADPPVTGNSLHLAAVRHYLMNRLMNSLAAPRRDPATEEYW
jgi:hypothetical protein